MTTFLLLTLGALTAAGDAPTTDFEWRPWPGHAEAALLQDGRQVGSWDALAGVYRALHPDGTWGPKEPRPPVAPPTTNFGIDEAKLSPRPRYTLNGKEVDRRAVEAVIDRARIPDFSDKLRLTVIGPAEETAPVLGDLASHPALAPYHGAVLAAAYEPTHWHVARAGFKTDGRPTLYVQNAAGAVLHRQDDYAGGPVALAETLGALARLRQPDPNYDPARDVDRRGRALSSSRRLPTSVLILAGLGAVAYCLSRRTN